MAAVRTYLDHNASAPLRPEARAAMLAALDLTGNASSVHAEGRRARNVVETAREQVASLVGARPEEVVFTSGATEANNWVLRAGWKAITVSSIEHESVLTPAHAASANSAADLSVFSCYKTGVVDLELIPPTCRALLSLQMANAETGVIQPVDQLVASAKGGPALVHSDAAQTVGRVPVDFRALGLDLMSLSAHKLGGPKGVGALVIRDGLDLPPLLAGGGQERRRRSGTENVAAIAGFGAAAEAARRGFPKMTSLSQLRDRLEADIAAVTPDARFIGRESPRLPNTTCIALPGADASTLLIKLDLAGIAVSAGSACSSGKIGGSHVLAAMGVDKHLAAGAIRLSLGHTTTPADIDRFVAAWRAIHGGRNPYRNDTTTASAAQRQHAAMSAGE